ncbi:hypothetical protein IEN85_09010 [Pelagicoccus sp. NFK12]|uniref:Uncharacterized protein n=1 Tax=Pelagicoccus enzymogenes TaxID=2773457 RepID=A0A927F7E7_9BACT|nr:hypothetical protein [Pelagicoccus enzymogenes]MBD5779632.1 hypothetical protein [Pelagicoccus enzymogenes]
MIALGAGVYGATIGLWRSPWQALYAGIKFPAVVLLTCAGNAVLNGILAQLHATGLSFRQTTLAILMSFSVASLVLLAMSPLAVFLLWNTPPLGSEGTTTGHSLTLLAHVGVIAFAGWCGTWRLYRLLKYVAPTGNRALSTLLAWLAGNLLLGSQVSWILRPFIGNPKLPVEFLRDDPFYGGFYEQVWKSLMQLFS